MRGVGSKDDPLSGTSSRVQAVVAYVPPTDLRIMVWDAEGHLPAYDKFPALELDLKEAAKYSPLLYVTPDDAPTLLIVGKKDELVPIKHSEDILKLFQEQKVPSDLLVFENSGHGLRSEDMQQAMARQVSWLQNTWPRTPQQTSSAAVERQFDISRCAVIFLHHLACHIADE